MPPPFAAPCPAFPRACIAVPAAVTALDPTDWTPPLPTPRSLPPPLQALALWALSNNNLVEAPRWAFIKVRVLGV